MKSLINRHVHIRFAYPAGVVEPGHTTAELVDAVDGVLTSIEDGFARVETDTVHIRRDNDGKTHTEATKHRCTLAHPQKYIASIMTSERNG